MSKVAALALVGAYVCYLGWREQEAKRKPCKYLAAYARGQADLCEELYQAKWGGAK